MKPRKNRLYAAILISLLTLSSCGGTISDTETAETTNDTTDEVTTEAAEKPEIPENTNYEGYTFRILTRPGMRLNEVYAEEANGDILSDSIHKRNREVEDKLGMKFDFIVSSSDYGQTD